MTEALVSAAPSPAHRAARVAHDVVEEVLLRVKKLPGRVDRTAIVAALERAVEGLQVLQASALYNSDHLDKLDAARGRVRDGVDAIEGHDHSDLSLSMAKRLRGLDRMLERAREATIDAVVSNQGAHVDAALAERAREEVPVVEPFAASLGALRLHTMDRELVRAHVDAEPEELIWDDYAEAAEEDENVEADEDPDAALDLAASLPELDEDEGDFRESDPAKRLPLLVANSKETVATMMPGVEGEVAQVERLVRTCLEDIGAMGNLRRLKDHERYDLTGMTRFESRMCACIDAVIALGQPFYTVSAPGSRVSGVDVLDAAVRYAREAITADPGRAFARAMLLCSVAGEDTVRAAVLALKESPPYTFRAQQEAFSLAPNPHVADAMHRLTSDDDSRVVALALDVLSARGEAKLGTIATLLEHPQEEVRVSAVRALGYAKERDAAEQILVDLCETEIDDDVWVAGVEALVRLGSPEGLALVRERMVEEVQEEDADMLRADLRTRCMRLLGVAGKPDDYLLLERLYFGDRGQAAALGFHGHVRLVDRLLLALEGATEGGVYLGQAGKREAALALQRITAAPFILGDERQIDPYHVNTDHRRWIKWWDENRSRFDPEVRYRFGEPFSGLFSVHELLADNVPVTTRRECAYELEVLLGEPFPLHDFAARQREALERARTSIEMAAAGGDHRFAPGRWLALR